MSKGFSRESQKQDKYNYKAYLNFLHKTLKIIKNNLNNQQVIYKFLKSNQEQTENLEKAIFHYTEALKEKSLMQSPIKWASAQHYLGLAYRQRVRGEQSKNLTKAIFHYKQALKIYSQDFLPEMWASLLENLGNAYLLRKSGNPEDTELAIQCFLETLKVRTYKDFLNEWAESQSNLGWAYLKRIQGDRSENIEQAIVFFQAALSVLIPSSQPLLLSGDSFVDPWAQAKSNLGSAYSRRIRGDRSENLERAINCFQDGLTVYTQASFPEEWADAMMRLGDALTRRIKGDWVNNFQQAIECYQQILSVYTKEAFPYLWARTKQHLGKVQLYYLLQGAIETNARVEDSNTYIEKAIAYFQEALQVFTPETFPKEWGLVKIDLGSLYFDFIQEESDENIQKAIAYFQEALQVYSPESSPLRWANAHNALGAAYIQPTLEDPANKIEKGLYHLHLSSQEIVRLQDPEQWAATQCNLGHAYEKRILGEKTQNITRAIDHYTAGLEVYKSSNFRRGTFLAGKELGNLAFDNQIWDKAILGYSAAIEEMELIRTWIGTENRRQKSLEGNIDIYQNAIQACINTGQIDKALEYVERSRSKTLVDLIASNDLYSGGEIPPAIAALLQQYENLQQQIDNLRSQNNSHGDRGIIYTDNRDRAVTETNNALTNSLETEKQDIWQQMRKLDPVLAGEIQVSAPNISQMQQLIDRPTTAILSFFTTYTETYIFVLRQDRISLHTCVGQGTENLQDWLHQEWSLLYRQSQSQRNYQWRDRMASTLTELARKLQIEELIEQHLSGIEELIIIPHQLLHQIPFAAIPLKNNLYLCDWLIAYSLQLTATKLTSFICQGLK